MLNDDEINKLEEILQEHFDEPIKRLTKFEEIIERMTKRADETANLLAEIKGFNNNRLNKAIDKSSAHILAGKFNSFLEFVIKEAKNSGPTTIVRKIEDRLKEIEANSTHAITPSKPLDFYLLAQSPATNTLAKKLTTKITNPSQLDMYGNGKVEAEDFRLFVRGYGELVNGVNQSAAMLLDSLMITATRDGLQSTLVKLPLKEYMAMRGLKDEKEIRAQVKRDIDALERVSFEYKGIGKQKNAWLRVSIAGGTVGQLKNGDIIFRFNQDFFDSFRASEKTKYLYMYFPREALQGNIRQNPYKYWLARKISEHKRINLGKPNEDIISVKTLVESCPNFPTYDEVMATDRAITRRMIEPFERDMDVFSEAFTWEYTTEQPDSYQTFIEAMIHVRWLNYPDTTKLKSEKAKSKKRTTQSKANNRKIDKLETDIKALKDTVSELQKGTDE